jgi:hypothetical protein
MVNFKDHLQLVFSVAAFIYTARNILELSFNNIFFTLVDIIQATALNTTRFNNPSFCTDENTETVCTNNNWPHPWIVFDLGTPISVTSSLSVLLG